MAVSIGSTHRRARLEDTLERPMLANAERQIHHHRTLNPPQSTPTPQTHKSRQKCWSTFNQLMQVSLPVLMDSFVSELQLSPEGERRVNCQRLNQCSMYHSSVVLISDHHHLRRRALGRVSGSLKSLSPHCWESYEKPSSEQPKPVQKSKRNERESYNDWLCQPGCANPLPTPTLPS